MGPLFRFGTQHPCFTTNSFTNIIKIFCDSPAQEQTLFFFFASNNVPQFLIEWSSSYIFVYLAGFSSEEDAFGPKHRKRTYMNQPHLRFEITSDDGFSVKASSIEGENSDLGFVDSKAFIGYAEEGKKRTCVVLMNSDLPLWCCSGLAGSDRRGS